MILITGSGGLIGSQAVEYFTNKGHDVIGIDNNMRSYFFGTDGDVSNTITSLKENKRYTHFNIDIRNSNELEKVFKRYGESISAIIHCAAQPSHDWASKEPLTDFFVNAVGTANILELYRNNCPGASFIFTSTNKVYGDAPNKLPLLEKEKRWEVHEQHEYSKNGIDEKLSIDNTLHSIFGASKVSADILVQEYGKYFGLNTVCFRGGCLTGPNHKGAELHGFLSYLVKCCVHEKKYKVFGYKAKQVRDNIHSLDLIKAFEQFMLSPKQGEIYNIGGGTYSNVSMLEAIEKIENLCSKKLDYSITEEHRIGDHIWYISDLRKYMNDYPDWKITRNVDSILEEMVSFECEKLH
jgi:CDP-paratose 2-epimerase